MVIENGQLWPLGENSLTVRDLIELHVGRGIKMAMKEGVTLNEGEGVKQRAGSNFRDLLLFITVQFLSFLFHFLPPPHSPTHTALDTNSQRTRIHEILSSMPRPNLCTLRFLMNHLHTVQANHEVNKMNASNLAIVFWPTLIRPPLMDLADPSKQLGWQLVMTRIIEHPEFVPED